MTYIVKGRSLAFAFGIAGIVVSTATLVGSYLRPVDSMNYFKQADEARPWIESGLASALAGFLFCFLGKKWWRATGMILALLRSIWWLSIGESLL